MLTGLPLRLVQVLCALLLLLKLAQWSFAGVFMDEAYYWMWGQHPALSYYDHPPLNSWLLSLSSTVFGWNVFALRLPVALAFLADIFALYLIARRIGGDWWGLFWLTLLLFLVTPIFSMVTNYALPDHILLTALLYAIYFFLRFFADRAAGKPGTTRDLLLGGLFLGLAGLAKYNAAFLGVGVALFVLLYDRALLAQLRLYLAAAIAIVLQAPVLVWNLTEGFASFAFQLGGRHSGISATIDGMVPLLLGIGIFIGPILLWPIIQFAFGIGDRSGTGGESARIAPVPGIGFARTTFFVSTIAIVALAFVTQTLFHWNLAAYAAMLPFLALYMRPRWLIPLHTLWGIAFAGLIFVNYAITPLTNLSGWRDEATAWSYDWSTIAEAVEAAREKYQPGFVAGVDYTTASLLGFALKDRNVASLDPAREQYDFWFDPEAHAGEDAILYADRWRPITRAIERQFESVEQIDSVVVKAQGRDLYRQRIYLARGYKPQ
jgi:4-amino-4-deoxy-L-arabinose transferase-like glycosyltransferase